MTNDEQLGQSHDKEMRNCPKLSAKEHILPTAEHNTETPQIELTSVSGGRANGGSTTDADKNCSFKEAAIDGTNQTVHSVEVKL